MYVSRTTLVAIVMIAVGCVGGWILAERAGIDAASPPTQLSSIAASTPGGETSPVAWQPAEGSTARPVPMAAPTPAPMPAPAAAVHGPASSAAADVSADLPPSPHTAPAAGAPAPGTGVPTSPGSATARGAEPAVHPTPQTAGPEPHAVRTAQPATTPSPPAVQPAGLSAQPTVVHQLVSPSFFAEQLFTPLPGATSRGVAFSEWESYRTDVAGRNILVTTDDSNFFRERDGKINANTGDTDASGLNLMSAVNSVIFGTESADEAPYQTAAAALVDLASASGGGDRDGQDSDDDDQDDDSDDDSDDDESDGAASRVPMPVPPPVSSAPLATAMVTTSSGCDPDGDDCGGAQEEWDFPYAEWLRRINGTFGTAIHTDEGTTLASGRDALVIGGDGYDDDDNRAVGENIIITRDDGNVVIGGSGPVNAQIGDSEQGAVIMDIAGTYVVGGGAY